MTLSNSRVTGLNSNIKYIGGMFVELFRKSVSDGIKTQLGRNVSFSNDFRIAADVQTNSTKTQVVINEGAVRSSFEAYVLNLTGNEALLNELSNLSPFVSEPDIINNTGLYSGIAIAAGISNSISKNSVYPKLLSKNQSVELITGYASSRASGSLSFPDSDQMRQQLLSTLFKPKTFECRKCVENDFSPIYPIYPEFNCEENEKDQFKAAFKVEMEKMPGGIQVGPTNDCRCCGQLAEDYYWDDSNFCGRMETLCLPLGVLINGSLQGYQNYGYDHKVLPFFSNKNNDMGNIWRGIVLRELAYVVNGKIVTGKFHTYRRNYSLDNIPGSAQELETFYIQKNGEISGVRFICNNSYRQDYENLPIDYRIDKSTP
jgi:hypothetical protein